MLSHSLAIGTAGWSYPHWEGVVFERGSRRDLHPVELLSHYVDCLEINTSFYQALAPEVSRLWANKVESNQKFRFTAKLQQRFTHDRVLDGRDSGAFKQGLWPLQKAGRLGAVLMQFPWSFRFTPENSEFVTKLSVAFGEFPLVAEMRHASWRQPGGLGLLADCRIGFCNIDQPAYTNAMPPTSIVTAKVGYARLHGRNPANRMGAYQADGGPASRGRQHDYLYTLSELAEWKTRVEVIREAAPETYVVFNNDVAGKSLVNALQMQRMFQGSKRLAPSALVRTYRVALEGFAATGGANPAQARLFQAA